MQPTVMFIGKYSKLPTFTSYMFW